MRNALAACVLACVCVVMIGAAIIGPRRGPDVVIYPQAKRSAALPEAGPTAAAAPAHFHWQAPDGWRDTAPVQHSFATLAVPQGQCSFSLVANRPGMFAMNIARWQRQLGVSGQEGMQEVPPVESALGSIRVLRMVNDERSDEAFLIGIATFSDQLLTIKLTAPAAALDDLQQGFVSLLASLKGDDGQH